MPRKDFLIIATWWGLVAGFLEGLSWAWRHSIIWPDLMEASLIVDPFLFLALGIAIVAFSRSVRRDVMMRSSLGFAFLAFYGSWANVILPSVSIVRFLSSLTAGLLVAMMLYRKEELIVYYQKRSFILFVAVALFLLILIPVQHRREEAQDVARLVAAPPRTPNILLIVVDTLRADHLSTYGYRRLTSPNITQLAKEGVLFRNAISASSWTLPAHASILTGVFPHSHHADGDDGNLGTKYVTLSEVLKSRGYRTAAFSANTGTFSRARGFGRGFIHFEDDFQNWGSTFGQTFYGQKIENRLCQMHVLRDLLGRVNSQDINRHALRWIGSGGRPFFVFLNYYDTHDPYLPPEPYVHKYTNVKHPGGRFSLHWDWFENLSPAQRQAALDAYDGAINYVDVAVHDLMNQLQGKGLLKNTIVIITSDHGEGFDEHGLMNHGNSLYMELIHVPLVFWGPGYVPGATVLSEPVSLTALPATVLDLLNDNHSAYFPEASLKPLWTGVGRQYTAPAISELAQLHWNPRYPNYYGPLQSITTSQWHYISGGNSGEQLFYCCTPNPDSLNLADTLEGRQICARFRTELQLAQQEGTPPATLQHTTNTSSIH